MIVLHLEDSDNDALLMESLVFEAWPDCKIHRVGTRAAFESALEHETFDLILSDYALPDFDGVSALKLARQRRPEKPFIFLSGTIGEERAINALKLGAYDYVVKDRPGRLVPAIKHALASAEESARRQRTEEALRESQERFQQLAEQSSDGFWFMEPNPRRLLYVSPAMERIGGLPASALYQDANAWIAAIHAEDRPRIEASFEAWLEGIIPQFEVDYRVNLPDGTLRWVRNSGTLIRDRAGKVVRVSGIAQDITERRRAEMRLLEQASLLDKACDAIIATDADFRVSYWNASAERIYGWSAPEAAGRDLRALGLEFDAARFAAAQTQLLATGEWRGHFRLRSRRGTQVEILTTWSLVRDPRGQVQSILLIDTDVTEAKKLETQFLRSQRMESIGTLAGGIAHDLNNVLAPIMMGADLLKNFSLDPAGGRIVSSIETSARHGAALVRQLLGFARGTEGERARLEVRPLLEDLGLLVRQTLSKRIELNFESTADPWPVFADATQLKQVILNLCINARDAMPNGGRITIGVDNVTVDEKGARLIPEGQPGRYLRLSVADTGTGIPPAIVEKIFDPFFTTKAAGKGTGLGLSTVRGIVKGHEGFLQVESEEGRGTTFRIFLPVTEQAPAVPAISPSEGRAETVLVIDDDPGVREMIQAFLECHGYGVMVAADGRAGLDRFRTHAGEIAAVITDMAMPGLRGAAVVAGLRELEPRLPIVAISGDFNSAGLAPEFGQEAHSVRLHKPLEPRQLLAALREAIDAGAPALRS